MNRHYTKRHKDLESKIIYEPGPRQYKKSKYLSPLHFVKQLPKLLEGQQLPGEAGNARNMGQLGLWL